MAPGILPEAISPLMKSSMAESFSRDNTAPGGGPSSFVAAVEGATRQTTAAIAANCMAAGRLDAKSCGDISLPDQSVGRREVMALPEPDPDGAQLPVTIVIGNKQEYRIDQPPASKHPASENASTSQPASLRVSRRRAGYDLWRQMRLSATAPWPE